MRVPTIALSLATLVFASPAFAEVNDDRFRAGLPEAVMVTGENPSRTDVRTAKVIEELRQRVQQLEKQVEKR